MTSPTGGGSEHVSRYRALGEFDSLIRAAREAKRALKELREEEAKLNAQSLAEDKKVTASKQNRAKAEKDSAESANKAVKDLNSSGTASKAGEDAGVSYSRGVGKGIDKDSRSGNNKQFLEAATAALSKAFSDAGEKSGVSFTDNFGKAVKKEFPKSGTKDVDESLSSLKNRVGTIGQDTGMRYVNGFATKIRDLNVILKGLGFDHLDLDVDIEDAKQSIKAVEFELTRLSHTTAEPFVRIDTNRALTNLRAIQKLFKDEVADEIIKDAERINKELDKIDHLPSGKSFKFWALTALSDMSRVFEEAEKGVSVFERLRRAASASGSGGGGGNFLKSFISGFDNFSSASSNMLQKLARVSGELYRMPGLIAVIVSAIPALISGIGALGGGALGLVSALGAASGVLAAFPGLITAVTSVTGGLKGAFSDLGEAMKAAQKAEAEEAEAKEKARTGTEKALTAQQKYRLALQQLSPDTRKVTEALVGFSKEWKNVQQATGNNFFKEVADQAASLNKLLPIAQDYFGRSATAVGKLADEGIRMITSGPWKRDFGIIAKNNASVIENMGKAGFSLVNVFRNIAVAAGPFTGWLTKGLREGAKAFEDWSAQARSNGTISTFLSQTTESLRTLWQIFKNLGNVVNSFFQSTVDEGQKYLKTLEDITGHWADVAKAQEEANSPLREWMTNIRPILASLGALVADLSRGIGKLASDQSSIKTMIDLLDTLRTAVLPPIFKILQELNQSGIAVTVTQALGDMLEAIANFLDSGATSALTVFVTVLANFFELLFNIASLPGVSDVLGGVASAIAALAAVSIVARFTGLFKLWDFFTWMIRNKGNLSGAFADAARGVAGLPTSGQTALPREVPSTIATVGSADLSGQVSSINNVAKASENATGKVSLFSRALGGIQAAGSVARGALGNLVSFLGGPWGIALGAATIGIGLLANHLADQKREAEDTKNAFLALKAAYGDIASGNTEQLSSLAATDSKLKDIISSAQIYQVSLRDVSGALNNQQQDLSRVNAQLDTQIANLKAIPKQAADGVTQQGIQAGIQNSIVAGQIKAAEDYKRSINEVANAQGQTTAALNNGVGVVRTYEERLAGMTQAQVDSAVKAGELDTQIRTLSSALDTLASASANNTDRSRALGDIIGFQTNKTMNANEAAERYSDTLLSLSETVNSNRDSIGKHGNALDINTRAGLRNRDALQNAAKATRDLFLQDIAAGIPMDQATKKHEERIKALKEEAKRLNLNKVETQKLIDTYGDIPEDIKTDIKTDEKGFQQVYADLLKLQIIQNALQNGKSVAEAQKDWNQASSSLYQRYIPGKTGDGPGFATGGPVWGAGSKTSDSIRAWLSNGEFVQPTDAVEHYGMPVMEALRTRKLDKAVIQEALPGDGNDKFASGGAAHSDNCVACASGGHRFAQGGSINVPIVVDPSKTKIDRNWANNAGDLGGTGGPGGYKWQMQVLRQAFPGLPMISGFRPGAVTLSGNKSYHSVGRAVDLPPRRDVAQWIRAHYGSQTKELITPYNDLNIWKGKPHRYTGAVWNQHNFAGGNAHDHWAFKNGGMVDLMKMMNLNNMVPNQQELPTVPRTLSPAASSVVNNSTDATTSFGDIIINNPTAERGGDSIRNALYRTQLLF